MTGPVGELLHSEFARRKMLVVDDTDVFRERLARAFRDRGLLVDAASNYTDAMELARQAHHEFAVVDMRMPGQSGLELLRDLRAINPKVRVLVLSGYGSIAAAIDAIRLGAVNFLSKPADADDILAAFQRSESNVLEPLPAEHEVPSLARAEWEHIHRVLSESGGNISEAARRLGIHRRSLQRKLRKLAPE